MNFRTSRCDINENASVKGTSLSLGLYQGLDAICDCGITSSTVIMHSLEKQNTRGSNESSIHAFLPFTYIFKIFYVIFLSSKHLYQNIQSISFVKGTTLIYSPLFT